MIADLASLDLTSIDRSIAVFIPRGVMFREVNVTLSLFLISVVNLFMSSVELSQTIRRVVLKKSSLAALVQLAFTIL